MNRNLAYTILAIFLVIIITMAAFKVPTSERKLEKEPEVVIIDNSKLVLIMIDPEKANNAVHQRALPEEVIPKEERFIPQKINGDFDILKPSGYTREQLEYAMSGESYKRMLPYVDTIIKAESKYGVNSLYLLCKLGLESGWGKYMVTKNNIGGWMDIHGRFKKFESVDSCIMHIANSLSTIFKADVGTRLEDVCERYCPDDGYLEMLMEIMEECEYRIQAMEEHP